MYKRMRLAIELHSVTEDRASKIANIIKEATGLSVRMFDVDKEGRRIE